MKRRVAKSLRRWADRLDPGGGPQVRYQIRVGTKAPSPACMRQYQQLQEKAFHSVG